MNSTEYAIGVHADQLDPSTPGTDVTIIDEADIDTFAEHVYRRSVGPWERVK